MTTIAFDGRYLAADTVGERGGNRSEHVGRKIHMRDGYAFAFGGYWGHYREALMTWYLVRAKGGEDAESVAYSTHFPAARDVSGAMLVIEPGNRQLFVFTHEAPFPDPEVFPFAIGTGGDIALGAMGAGVSAMEAVRIAMRWDIRTGGEVDFIDLEWPDNGVQRWNGTMPSSKFPMPVSGLAGAAAVALAEQRAVIGRMPVRDTHGTPIRDYVKFEPVGRAEMCDHGYVRSTCSKC